MIPTKSILLIPPPENAFTLIRREGSHFRRYSPLYLTTAEYSVALVLGFPDRIFVFGDNIERAGHGGQAVIRSCENSFGIRTKKQPKNTTSAFFSDSDYILFRRMIDHDFENLDDLNREHPIVLSANGYGTGRALLYNTAPRCYTYLVTKLNHFCDAEIFNPYYHPGTDAKHGPTL